MQEVERADVSSMSYHPCPLQPDRQLPDHCGQPFVQSKLHHRDIEGRANREGLDANRPSSWITVRHLRSQRLTSHYVPIVSAFDSSQWEARLALEGEILSVL